MVRRPQGWLRWAAITLAVLGLVICVTQLVRSWPTVRAAAASADSGWLAAALGLAVVWASGLVLLWALCLRAVGQPGRLRAVTPWFFAGELAKYVPGGVWPVIGRAELATRAGLPRPAAYGSVVLSLVAMTLGAMGAGAVLSVALGVREDARWLAVGLALGAMVVAAASPSMARRAISLFGRATGRSVGALETDRIPPLVLSGLPVWLVYGGVSVAVTEALGFEHSPVRIAFAAVAGWTIGFLAVPVPAGAGIREVVFLALSGLEAGPAVAVAAGARCLHVLLDAAAGSISLFALGARGRAEHVTESER